MSMSPSRPSLNPTGLADSTVRDTTVALPAGVAIDPSGGDGLSACGVGEVALESAAEQTCPESSKIGSVEVHTPLLPNPLVGAAYLAQQEANPFGSLVAMYIVVYDPVSGVRIKVAGEVTAGRCDRAARRDVQQHAAAAVRRSRVALLRWVEGAVGYPGVVRRRTRRRRRSRRGPGTRRWRPPRNLRSPAARTAAPAPTRCRSTRR